MIWVKLFSIETTLLTQQVKFASALETAKQYIKDESRQHKFYLAIDVRQSRLRGIKPISSYQDKKNHLDETEIEWALHLFLYMMLNVL